MFCNVRKYGAKKKYEKCVIKKDRTTKKRYGLVV